MDLQSIATGLTPQQPQQPSSHVPALLDDDHIPPVVVFHTAPDSTLNGAQAKQNGSASYKQSGNGQHAVEIRSARLLSVAMAADSVV